MSRSTTHSKAFYWDFTVYKYVPQDLLFNFYYLVTSGCTTPCTMGLTVWFYLEVMVWVMENCMAGQLDCSHAIAIVQDMASEGQYMSTTETKFL